MKFFFFGGGGRGGFKPTEAHHILNWKLFIRENLLYNLIRQNFSLQNIWNFSYVKTNLQ